MGLPDLIDLVDLLLLETLEGLLVYAVLAEEPVHGGTNEDVFGFDVGSYVLVVVLVHSHAAGGVEPLRHVVGVLHLKLTVVAVGRAP